MNRFDRKVRSLLAASVLVGAGALGVTAATAAPASAASHVTSCFVYSNGARYTGQPVYLQAYTTGGWVNIWKGNSDIAGCVHLTIGTGHRAYYLRTVAQTQVGTSSHWIGTSPYYANPGNLAANIGTGVVRNYWY